MDTCTVKSGELIRLLAVIWSYGSEDSITPIPAGSELLVIEDVIGIRAHGMSSHFMTVLYKDQLVRITLYPGEYAKIG